MFEDATTVRSRILLILSGLPEKIRSIEHKQRLEDIESTLQQLEGKVNFHSQPPAQIKLSKSRPPGW